MSERQKIFLVEIIAVLAKLKNGTLTTVSNVAKNSLWEMQSSPTVQQQTPNDTHTVIDFTRPSHRLGNWVFNRRQRENWKRNRGKSNAHVSEGIQRRKSACRLRPFGLMDVLYKFLITTVLGLRWSLFPKFESGSPWATEYFTGRNVSNGVCFRFVRSAPTYGGGVSCDILAGSFVLTPVGCCPSLNTLSELPISSSPFMEHYHISGGIETTLHYVRENVVLSCIGVLAVYSIASWINGLQRRVSPQFI
jgi:hypothetical protein